MHLCTTLQLRLLRPELPYLYPAFSFENHQLAATSWSSLRGPSSFLSARMAIIMAYLLLLYDSFIALVDLAEPSRQRLNEVYRTIRYRNVLATQVSALAGVDSSQQSAVRNLGPGSPDHAFTSGALVEDYQ